MTLAEAQAQLITVNSAIEQFLQGKRLKSLKVGSGAFQRFFEYSELTLESLQAYRNELINIISSLETSLPTFRTNATIPLLVTKDIF